MKINVGDIVVYQKGKSKDFTLLKIVTWDTDKNMFRCLDSDNQTWIVRKTNLKFKVNL